MTAVESPADAVDGDPQVLPSHLKFPVVGIGASAGGIGALLKLFGQMPNVTGMGFVVVLHLSPDHESSLPSILATTTSMPVLPVKERISIRPDHIYVISPSMQLMMSDGQLIVTPMERLHGRHTTIDIFFRTLAEAHRELAISVVLSGTGLDGALGLRRVKEKGGICIVQSPEDAEYDGMPQSAIATGAVDFVLPAAEIPGKLIDIWKTAQQIQLPYKEEGGHRMASLPTQEAMLAATDALGDIMVMLHTRTGHDFRHYKRATVLRRIERRMQINGVPTLPAYRAFLQMNQAETAPLLQDMLISVTNFFRDQEAFESLDHQLDSILNQRKNDDHRIRAWVAGCATGEEAYSLAMMLCEKVAGQMPPRELQIFASDIDERAIAIGRAGRYPESVKEDIEPGRLRQFCVLEDGQYRMRKELREKILFTAHNILRDPPFSDLDLICCRNLMIYLDREIQAQVLEIFHFALRPGGLLFLGTSESTDVVSVLFTAVDKKNRIYRANALPRSIRTVSFPSVGGRTPLVALPMNNSAPQSMLGDLHQRLLAAHAPPSLLLDAGSNILHCSQRANVYLRFASGQPTQNLLAVIQPELRLELRTAIFEAWRSGECVQARRVRLDRAGQSYWVTMTARPVQEAEASFMLALFDEVHISLSPEANEEEGKDPMLVLLEEELQKTREQLHGSIDDSAASTEELKASVEELQAINEEFRSTTEELETSKEELQSLNEELTTVNHELKNKVEEAGKVNDDLKNLIASTDIATIFVDRSMRIKRYTPRAAELFNLIPSDAGRSLLDITHRLAYDQLEGDANEAFQSLRVVEREVRSRDGKTYLLRALPYRTHEDVIDGAVLNFLDITAMRKVEERLRAEEARMRLVFESTQDYAIMMLDTEGLVTNWNQGAQRLFGFTAAEIMGRSFVELYTPEDRAEGAPEMEMQRARDEGRATDERWHMRKDGSRFYCSGVMMPLRDGGLLGYAKIGRDLTDMKRTEAQQEGLLANEKAVRAELQAASTLKDEFLAVMSHELKHPLNLIHVNAEMLSRLPEVRQVPAAVRASDVIRRTVMSQAKIIDDLLDLSRMHTGKLTLHCMTVQWSDIIASVAEAMRTDATLKNQTITVEIDPAASQVHADPVRVEQIVWNLVSNALKFTPEGGAIQLRLSVDQGSGCLSVIDNGQGMEPDFVQDAFDMFRQANRSTTRLQGGMGIGLALVKHLAEQHGGRVAISSPGLGKGACFTVWLPLAQSAPSQPEGAAQRPALKGLRLLAVDDTVDTLESFATLLRLEGAEVTTAPGGREALAAIEEAEFDLILSDIAMPNMDGYQLIALLRQHTRTAQVPVIAVTGFGRPHDEMRALKAGFDAHLSKPVGIDALTQTIHRLVRRQG
jgi:two-component system CheB/CheR fusion protein